MTIYDFLANSNWFTDFPNGKTSYNADQQPEYLGGAKRGSLTSQPAWRIVKFSYDENGLMTGWVTSAPDQIWDNRATTVTYA